jgi:fructose-bisphosphate aldolase class II
MERAFSEKWALGAFNTSNLEMTQAIAWGLEQQKSPGIIQTSESAIEYAGLEIIYDIVRDVSEKVSVPIFLHLDHGRSFEVVEKCVLAGYKSVMIDGSKMPFAENVALTKKVVDFAHAKGVWVEGEIGAIQGKEGMLVSEIKVEDSVFTDPDEAAEFVAQTNVDSLAVSVGTIHGAFRGEERIRFERLAAIKNKVKIPMVLHGASGLPQDEITRAVKEGIVKVNIDTELRESFHDSVVENEERAGNNSVDPRKMLAPGRDAVKELVAQKTLVVRSAGRMM